MKTQDELKVVIIGDGNSTAQLATRMEEVNSGATVQFLAGPRVPDEPVAAWLAKVAAETESADWLVVGLHRNPAVAKSVLQGVHRLAPQAVLWNSLSTCTATEATAWLNQSPVYGWSHVGPQWNALECSAPLQKADRESGLGLPLPLLDTWEVLTGMDAAEIVDSPGGVQARIVHSLINEAAMALKEQLCSPENLDMAMKLGVNYPEGPLHWANRIGLETVLATMECLYRNYGEERYRPAPLLRDMALAQVSFNVKE